MDSNLLLRNRTVARLLVGVPEGHEHIRARIETATGDVITLQEATLAALARAYVDVATHPQRRAIELRSETVQNRKDGFAIHQLIEVPTPEHAVRVELAAPPPEPAKPAVSPMSPSAEDTGLALPAPPRPAAAPTSAPADETRPHDLDELAAAIAAAEAAQARPEPEPDDLVLDELSIEDDGPVFGDVPTLHSKPTKKKRRSPRKK
jgi:hypothetical protein